mmetsp:Transcript_17010/g.64855  ORF Transcript_17010/g.64855 Transcript_17010/m.64855 type:complete len:916 (-) Transcript_17010:1037-3784(-)
MSLKMHLLWAAVAALQLGSSRALRRVASREPMGSSAEAAAEDLEVVDTQAAALFRGGTHRQLSIDASADDATSPNDHLVTDLPGVPSSYTASQWAGRLTVDEAHKGRLFYWLFAPKSADSATLESAPLVIWLNGGPGCSSMDGLFLENGPFRVSGTRSLKENAYAWNEKAFLMYVDQPVDTGFSYIQKGQERKSDGQIEADFYEFLQKVLRLHTTLQGRKVIFAGESHAGHFIPTIVKFILDKQASPPSGGQLTIDVEAMAIGNGWFDPYHQYGIAMYAWARGLIGKQQLPTLAEKEKDCQSRLKSRDFRYGGSCIAILDHVVDASNPGQTYGRQTVTMYDTRSYGGSFLSSYPPGKDELQRYLTDSQVTRAIHADTWPTDISGTQWKECRDEPWNALKYQDGLGVTAEIRAVLESGVRSVFFNGEFDLICNFLNAERALHNLNWTNLMDWKMANRHVWRSSTGEPFGFAKSYGKLDFLVVRNAGHMVPMDNPKAAHNIIDRIIQGHSFQDGSQSAAVPVSRDPRDLVEDDEDVPPMAPSFFAGSVQPFESSVRLNFTTIHDASHYRVVSIPDGLEVTVTAPPAKVSDVRPGVPYSFQVFAQADGLWSKPSEPSEPVIAGCPYALPNEAAREDTEEYELSYCCGHGVCGADGQGGASCFCREGFRGANCEFSEETSARDCKNPYVSDGTEPDAAWEDVDYPFFPMPNIACGSTNTQRARCDVYVRLSFLASTDVAFDGNRGQKGFEALLAAEFEMLFQEELLPPGGAVVYNLTRVDDSETALEAIIKARVDDGGDFQKALERLYRTEDRMDEGLLTARLLLSPGENPILQFEEVSPPNRTSEMRTQAIAVSAVIPLLILAAVVWITVSYPRRTEDKEELYAVNKQQRRWRQEEEAQAMLAMDDDDLDAQLSDDDS